MSEEVSYMADDRAGAESSAEPSPDERVPEGAVTDQTRQDEGVSAAADSSSPTSNSPADDHSPATGESGTIPSQQGGDAEIAGKVATDSVATDSEPEETEKGTAKTDEVEDQGGDANAKPVAVNIEDDEPDAPMQWYILKVQSNREKSIADALRRRVKIAGLETLFGEIIVPTEKRTEFKGGKKKIVNQKLWPGYIVAQMVINDDTWFLVRETPGIGDFTGAAGTPTPLPPQDIDRIVAKPDDEETKQPTLKISFGVGDRVKINDGTFDNFEGEVSTIDEASGRVQVMINIFGRSTPVELEYWQVETL